MTGQEVHREVLENLEDGVLVVGLGGRIETLNPAAERILGLDADGAAGRGFAEMLILREGFDDFTQMLIDATTERTGVQRRVVALGSGGEARSLSVATSYLRRTDAGGASEAVAVIAVFSDITELRELRETELRLAKEAEVQHRRLQDAYREIEDRNASLASALRKVRVVQGLGTVLALGLFLGAGFWTTRSLDLFEGVTAKASAVPVGEGHRLTVKPRRISDGITLRGKLSPWRVVAVRSPIDGNVAAVRFRTGQEVAEGETLLELDLARARQTYARERRRHATALARVRDLENWDNSREMVRARRSFTKTRLDMQGHLTAINKSRFLFGEGLISEAEHEDAERQFRSQELDFEAAEEEFALVRAQGSKEALKDARLELEGATAALRAAEEALEHETVRAPIGGVVLARSRGGKEPEAGGAVRSGQDLLSIGDFSRMAAAAQVDETDVVKLQAGQKVTVTGNAFRGLKLKGEVTHVSSQADPKARGIPKFDVTVTLDHVGPEAAARIRTGMSAKLRIVTYSNPKALLVPIEAVRSRGRKHHLRVFDPATGDAKEREVEVGPTTWSSVEIRAGLEAGEIVLLPGG